MSSRILRRQANDWTRPPYAVLFKPAAVAIFLISGGLTNLSAQESWYKIELSIFSNENLADREQERWQADRNILDYPEDMTRLEELGDLLLIDSLLPAPLKLQTLGRLDTQMGELELELEAAAKLNLSTPDETLFSDQELQAEAIGKVGPFPTQAGAPFKFLDFEQDEYLRLPSNLSDFAQTNQALRRSPDHRLLFHAVWRQPVSFENEAKAILVEGGERYGNQSELLGSLTIRFNENADRIVLGADIWLTEFVIDNDRNQLEPLASAAAERGQLPANLKQWQLPELPASIIDGPLQILQNRLQTDKNVYHIQNVFHMLQDRAMRSNEFHYMDHPALGIVVQVEQYELPALPEAENLEDISFDDDNENGASLESTAPAVAASETNN
jgi:hypothetical protein